MTQTVVGHDVPAQRVERDAGVSRAAVAAARAQGPAGPGRRRLGPRPIRAARPARRQWVLALNPPLLDIGLCLLRNEVLAYCTRWLDELVSSLLRI